MKKLINWSTPKQYQKEWESESNSNPAKLPKPKSKYCKKLKGDHQFGEWKENFWGWSKAEHTGVWERFCVGCNRKDTWLAPQLPGQYWEIDSSARPPGYEKI